MSEWQVYASGDTILHFNAIVAAVNVLGHGRLTKSQFLNSGDLFCYLEPFPENVGEMRRAAARRRFGAEGGRR